MTEVAWDERTGVLVLLGFADGTFCGYAARIQMAGIENMQQPSDPPPTRAPGKRVPTGEAKAAPAKKKAAPGKKKRPGWGKDPHPPGSKAITSSPIGRPTIYGPEVCAAILAAASDGYSLEGAAVQAGISWSSLKHWKQTIPEFLAVMEEARLLAASWWEQKARQSAAGEIDGNARLIEFGLRNRSRHASGWHDTRTLEVTGANGGAIQSTQNLQVAPMDVSNLNAEQREQLRTLLLAAATPPRLIEAVVNDAVEDADVTYDEET